MRNFSSQLLLLTMVLIAGCAGPMEKLQKSEIGYERNDASMPVSPYVGVQWHLILDAVGNDQLVFDSFVNDFADLVQVDSSRIASATRLSASGPNPATSNSLRTALNALRPEAKDACLLYLTGHGLQNKGIVFAANLPPAYLALNELEYLLQASPCANHPTVVVVSACYSGLYMKEGVANANRIVITASAPDAPSFGCDNNRRYTFFDQCFIDEWKKSVKWEQLGDGIRKCVRQEEASHSWIASRPQFFYGRNMRDLDLPKGSSAN
jgi:hypothetical protein